MPDLQSFQSDLRRYAGLIEPLLKNQRTAETQNDERRLRNEEAAVVFPLLLSGSWTPGIAKLVEPLIIQQAPSTGSGQTVESPPHPITPSPNHRLVPDYERGSSTPRPLPAYLVYCWLQAYRLAYETMPREDFGRWEESLRVHCERLEIELTEIDWPALSPPNGPADGFAASGGDVAAEAVWIALALRVAGDVFVRDPWTDLAADTFGKLAKHQQPNGSFLRATAADNIETLTYHELVILHAAASYAVQAADRPLSVAVARAAEFHLHHTQPDHATTQPWALFAFIWYAPARSLADQMLHGATTAEPAGMSALPLVLLADALYCLRLFL